LSKERSALNTLQTLLVILDGQKLAPGYLTPAGSGTALETVIAMIQKHDPYYLLGNPITPPALLFTPAAIRSLPTIGQTGIFLDGVDGNLDLSKTPQPAYVFNP
jgi:hypothetical protein